jgi:hypothetical protein
MHRLAFLLFVVAGCASSDDMCTTAACAAAPCTAHCSFQHRGSGCPDHRAATVSPAKVLACSGVCASLDQPDASYGTTIGGACVSQIPGCVLPWCSYASACEQTGAAFGANQAVICAANEACVPQYSGGDEDSGLYCLDFATAADLATPVDGGTSD